VPLVEARDAAGALVASVKPGHPCRATIAGDEMIVGTTGTLIAQHGADRWTGEPAENGTTLKRNDQIAGRIHAGQLFDADGMPVLRVLPDGGIADRANAIVRHAVVSGSAVKIGDLTVTGTTDVTLATMLTAREALPEVRALAACLFVTSRGRD
jgi:hypothetical protein